ncbi:hypothetical protein [Streptomyces sp. NPDC056255]|uniref:hypothetical protein n=1 Tax=Streptomyces sp. NPDC056255 TaxID=3345764 RepID=UPI0035D90414
MSTASCTTRSLPLPSTSAGPPQDGDIIVRTVRYGGISTTDLDQRLRECGITTLPALHP